MYTKAVNHSKTNNTPLHPVPPKKKKLGSGGVIVIGYHILKILDCRTRFYFSSFFFEMIFYLFFSSSSATSVN